MSRKLFYNGSFLDAFPHQFFSTSSWSPVIFVPDTNMTWSKSCSSSWINFMYYYCCHYTTIVQTQTCAWRFLQSACILGRVLDRHTPSSSSTDDNHSRFLCSIMVVAEIPNSPKQEIESWINVAEPSVQFPCTPVQLTSRMHPGWSLSALTSVSCDLQHYQAFPRLPK